MPFCSIGHELLKSTDMMHHSTTALLHHCTTAPHRLTVWTAGATYHPIPSRPWGVDRQQCIAGCSGNAHGPLISPIVSRDRQELCQLVDTAGLSFPSPNHRRDSSSSVRRESGNRGIGNRDWGRDASKHNQLSLNFNLCLSVIAPI